MVSALLVYLACVEVSSNSGGFLVSVYEPYRSLKEIPGAVESNPVDQGREIYSRMCSSCHQPNGVGNPINQCPPLTKSDWVLRDDPSRIIRIVLNGARGPITVNGANWDSASGMLAFRDVLSDEQIASVLSYVRGAPEWGNNAATVLPEMVKQAREVTANRNGPWTISELLKAVP